MGKMTIIGYNNLKDTFCKEQWLNAPYFHGSQHERMRLQMATNVIKVRCLNWIASCRGTKPWSTEMLVHLFALEMTLLRKFSCLPPSCMPEAKHSSGRSQGSLPVHKAMRTPLLSLVTYPPAVTWWMLSTDYEPKTEGITNRKAPSLA